MIDFSDHNDPIRDHVSCQTKMSDILRVIQLKCEFFMVSDRACTCKDKKSTKPDVRVYQQLSVMQLDTILRLCRYDIGTKS